MPLLKRRHILAVLLSRPLAVVVLALTAALAPIASELANASGTGEAATRQYALVAEFSELVTFEPGRGTDGACGDKQAKLYAVKGQELATRAPDNALQFSRYDARGVLTTHAARSGLTRAPPLA